MLSQLLRQIGKNEVKNRPAKRHWMARIRRHALQVVKYFLASSFLCSRTLSTLYLAEKKKRTLTNLYNARPTWLDLTHKPLDEAVFAAYGWKNDLSDEEILDKLLSLNMERSKA